MRKLTTLALAAVAAAGLSAQGVDINGGLQTGLSLPVGDLQDKTDFGTNQVFGAHIGGHLDFNITPHHQVRGYVEYNDFPGSTWDSGIKNRYEDLRVGADWVYNFQNPSSGWYTIAGASVNHVKQSSDFPDGSSSDLTQSGQSGIRGGGGYNFSRNFSLEGTLNQVWIDKNGASGFGFDTATWVQVSAVFRFK